jgi:hypothetical protein
MSPSQQAAGPPNGDRAGVPEPSAASWRQAESELFSGLLQRPDVYEEVVALVGATVDRLRGLEPTAAALLEAADTVAALVRELAEQRGRAAPGADPLLLGRAALAVRHREVVAHAVAAHRLAQLRDADVLRRTLRFTAPRPTTLHLRLLTGDFEARGSATFATSRLVVTLPAGSSVRRRPGAPPEAPPDLVLTLDLPAGESSTAIDYELLP